MVNSKVGRLWIVVFAASLVVVGCLLYGTYTSVDTHRVYMYSPWAAERLSAIAKTVPSEAMALIDITDVALDDENIVKKAAHWDYHKHDYEGCDETPSSWNLCVQKGGVTIAGPIAFNWRADADVPILYRCPVIDGNDVKDGATEKDCVALHERLTDMAISKSKAFILGAYAERIPMLASALVAPSLLLFLVVYVRRWVIAAPDGNR